MEFLTSSSELSKHLQLLNGVISSTANISLDLDSLDSFLLELKENQLIITASDLENTLITKLEVETNALGAIALPARLITDILKTFPASEPLKFTKEKTKKTEVEEIEILKIKSSQGDYKLPIKRAEDFPSLPLLESQNSFELEAEIFLDALNKTSFATANDELRPVMNGVFFSFGPEGSLFVATDAHKLVKYHLQKIKFSYSAQFILPKKTLNLLKSILAETKEMVKIEPSSSHIRFSFGDKTLVSRLIEGKYPNYEVVIPKINNKKISIDRTYFLSTLKRLSLLSSKTTRQITLDCRPAELKIIAEDRDFSYEGEEKLKCHYQGEEIKIGFNSKFLIEMLSKLDSKEISFEMSEPSKAGILKPIYEEKKDEELLMLIMPIVVN